MALMSYLQIDQRASCPIQKSLKWEVSRISLMALISYSKIAHWSIFKCEVSRMSLMALISYLKIAQWSIFE
jgi:hypothetical protein